jgi:hypothetical protein
MLDTVPDLKCDQALRARLDGLPPLRLSDLLAVPVIDNLKVRVLSLGVLNQIEDPVGSVTGFSVEVRGGDVAEFLDDHLKDCSGCPPVGRS